MLGHPAEPDDAGCRTCGHPEHWGILRSGVRSDLGVRCGTTRSGPLDRSDRSCCCLRKGAECWRDYIPKCSRLDHKPCRPSYMGWEITAGVGKLPPRVFRRESLWRMLEELHGRHPEGSRLDSGPREADAR